MDTRVDHLPSLFPYVAICPLLHYWPLSLSTLVTSLIPSVAAENTVPLFPLTSQSEKPPTSSPHACPPSPEGRSHQLEPTARGGCSIGFYLALISFILSYLIAIHCAHLDCVITVFSLRLLHPHCVYCVPTASIASPLHLLHS